MSYAIPITHKAKRRRIGRAKQKFLDRLEQKHLIAAQARRRLTEEALERAGLYTARPQEVTFQ